MDFIFISADSIKCWNCKQKNIDVLQNILCSIYSIQSLKILFLITQQQQQQQNCFGYDNN